MVIRNILTAFAFGLLSSGLPAQPDGVLPGEQRGEVQERHELVRMLRERINRNISEGDTVQDFKRPRPFLLLGDPRFEKMSRLLFVPETQLDEAIRVWAAESGRDEQDVSQARRFIQHLRKRIERQADNYATEKGLVVDEMNREEFVREFLQLQIEAEQAVRRQAEAELKQHREKIDLQLLEKYGP